MTDRRAPDSPIASRDSLFLITGAGGFIGSRVVERLLALGHTNIRCLVRPASGARSLTAIAARYPGAQVELLEGNLLSMEACHKAVRDAVVVYHVAAGIDKSYPGAFLNSVVATRNLLEAAVAAGSIRRVVSVSSFAVYTTRQMKRGDVLSEKTPVEPNPVCRGDAYSYGKVKQEELVRQYAKKFGLSVAIVRPGAVFGPGRTGITGRVGIDTFGIYLHLGGANILPLSYVENCADAIVLAGLRREADSETFNIVDDNLPTSRAFLREYKRSVGRFRSVYVPYPVTYLFCVLWEKYSRWSKGQLPPVFNPNRASAEWGGYRFSNDKLKRLLDWEPRVPMGEALTRYFDYQRAADLETKVTS